MKATVVQFDKVGSRYERLLMAFIESWKKNAKIPLQVLRVDPPKEVGKKKSFYWNHEKLKHWVDAVDQDTILIDADMLCMADISNGFNQVDNLGFTIRPGKFKYNGGVVFVKYTPESRKFLKKWLEIDHKMLNDWNLHRPWHEKYAGLNQSSMGYLVESGYRNLVAELPCSTYNLCDGWHDWQKARMIHVKGDLRLRVLNGKGNYGAVVDEIAPVWDKYYEMAPK